MILSLIHDWLLSGPVFWKLSAGNHSCGEIMFATAVLFFEYSILKLFSPHLLALTVFLFPFLGCYHSLRKGSINVLFRSQQPTITYFKYLEKS